MCTWTNGHSDQVASSGNPPSYSHSLDGQFRTSLMKQSSTCITFLLVVDGFASNDKMQRFKNHTEQQVYHTSKDPQQVAYNGKDSQQV